MANWQKINRRKDPLRLSIPTLRSPQYNAQKRWREKNDKQYQYPRKRIDGENHQRYWIRRRLDNLIHAGIIDVEVQEKDI